jgi:hypothetical protein
MNDRFTTRLQAGRALTLAASRQPRRLVVTRGMLWATFSGDARDHWLAAGEGVTLRAGLEAVVEGGPDAEFQLLQPAAVRGGTRRPGARLIPFTFRFITS